jgi:hypothetical protein
MVDNIVRLALRYPILPLATLMPLFLILMIWIKRIPLEKDLKFVYWFCIFFFITDLPLWITTGLKINNRDYYFFRELAIQLFLISTNYYLIHSERKKKNILILVSGLAFLGIASFFFSRHFNKPAPTEITSICRLFLIFIILMHFHNMMSKQKIRNISNYPFFWIYSGVLILSSGSVLIFLFFEYTISLTIVTLFKLFSQFLDVLVILMFIFMGIGFIKAKKYYLNE